MHGRKVHENIKTFRYMTNKNAYTKKCNYSLIPPFIALLFFAHHTSHLNLFCIRKHACSKNCLRYIFIETVTVEFIVRPLQEKVIKKIQKINQLTVQVKQNRNRLSSVSSQRSWRWLFSVWMSAFASASQRAKTNVIWTWYKEEFKSRFNLLCQTNEIANTHTHTHTHLPNKTQAFRINIVSSRRVTLRWGYIANS